MTAITRSINTENVVASTAIGLEIDLQKTADDLDGADYDPEVFPGLVYRTQDPTAAMLLFRSGKVVCTGAKSIEHIHQSLWIFFEELRKLGINISRDPKIVLQNIVASADLGCNLNLNAVAIGLGLENIEYNPKEFPGLVYKLNNPSVIFLLFGPGKIVVTGASGSSEVQNAVPKLVTRLREISSGNSGVVTSNTSGSIKLEGLEARESAGSINTDNRRDYDVFISHASEDKEDIVRPLAHVLSKRNIEVWFDEFELSLGDSLRESIDSGLSNSKYGLVVLSDHFFNKRWTQYELNSLVSRHLEEDKVIIPLWYNVEKEEIMEHSPVLADLLAEKINQDNIAKVANVIQSEVKGY